MGWFDVTKFKASVSKSVVLAIILERIVEILLALDLPASRLIKEECVLKVFDVVGDGMVAGRFLQDGLERIRQLVGVRKRTRGGGENVQETGEDVVVPQPVARPNVGEVKLRQKRPQVLGAGAVIWLCNSEGHAAPDEVIGKGVGLVRDVQCLAVFGKGKGVDANLESAVSEVRVNVLREHL